MNNSKRSVFGIVFLTIFFGYGRVLDYLSLFPDMLDHYLFWRKAWRILSKFVIWVREFGYDSLLGNPSFRLETVIFGGVLGSLYAALQFFFAPIWGGLSDRYGRKPILLITLTGTAIGYFLWIMAGDFWLLLLSRVIGGMAGGNISVATAAIADVTTREKVKRHGFCGYSFWTWICSGSSVGWDCFSVGLVEFRTCFWDA